MRVIKSLGYAIKGIADCIRHEKNFRVQWCIAIITILGGFYFRISPYEWMGILFCLALVLSLEMINTSIEKLSDKICNSFDPVIMEVKDIAAGAVFLSSLISFVIGMIIFFPKIRILFLNKII